MGHAVRFALILSLAIVASCDDDDDTTAINNSKTVVSIQFAQAEEGDTGDSNTVSFTLGLNQASNEPIAITYETSDGSAVAGVDYTAVSSGSLTIPAGETSATIDINVLGDEQFEENDTFNVTLLTVSGGAAELSVIPLATGTIVNDDPIALNDTGITFGATATANNTNCSGSSIASQDCSSGRDNAVNNDADGHAGFSFTKLDANGDPLADQTQDYATTPFNCVRDEVTGLVWETKTNDGGLRDRDWTYTYYDGAFADDDDAQATGGTDRIWAGPLDAGAGSGLDNCGNSDLNCATDSYVSDVNDAQLCGFSDWRLPTREELRTIVNYNAAGVAPAVDADYFPNMLNGGSEWTSSPVLSTDADGPLLNQRHSLTNNTAVFAPTDLNTGAGIRLVRFAD